MISLGKHAIAHGGRTKSLREKCRGMALPAEYMQNEEEIVSVIQ